MSRLTPKKDVNHLSINDMTSDFACFKVSAMQKALMLCASLDQKTIGPHAAQKYTHNALSENIENTPNSYNIQKSKEAGEPSSSPPKRSSITFSKQKLLLEYELQRKENVRMSIEHHKQEMEKRTQAMQKEMELLKTHMAIEREQKNAEIQARIQAEEEQIAKQEEIRRKHELQLYTQRRKEQQEKLRKEEEIRRKVKEKEEVIEKIGALRTEFWTKYRDIGMISKACKDRNSVTVILTPYLASLKKLCQQMEYVNEKTKTGDVASEDLSIAEYTVNQTEEILQSFKSDIEQVDNLYDAEVIRCAEQAKLAEIQTPTESECQQQLNVVQVTPEAVNNVVENNVGQVEAAEAKIGQEFNKSSSIESIAQSVSAEGTPTQEAETPPVPEKSDEETLYQYVDKESLQMYISSQLLLENQTKAMEEFVRSDVTKKFRFECQKSINIPMNAVSAISEQHLRDKYERVNNLLIGKSHPNLSQYPQGSLFCQQILAKTLVSLGETLIDTKAEAAFPVAAVAVALWNDHADFGNLLLAYFHKICPFTVPVFLPQQEGQSSEEYYKALGYKYSDNGVVEEQNKFLKRMSGVIRLYASIIITKQRRGVTKIHPYGLQNAWRWLAAVLNIIPRPEFADICATLLLIMLEITGNALWNAYPKQFPKLLALLVTEYYPQLQKFGDNCGGPFQRLELFLNSILASGCIPPPDGQLPHNFW